MRRTGASEARAGLTPELNDAPAVIVWAARRHWLEHRSLSRRFWMISKREALMISWMGSPPSQQSRSSPLSKRRNHKSPAEESRIDFAQSVRCQHNP